MSDVDRIRWHPGDYKIDEYGGTYRAQSRLAAGLPPVASSGNAESVIEACQTALGADGGVIRLAPNTTYDCDDTVNLTSNITLIGGGWTTVVRPSASPWAKALIALDEWQGSTTTRQEKNVVKDMQLNLRSYAGSIGIAHYNLKDSDFSDLYITGFKDNAIFMQAQNSSTYNMWTNYHEIFFECNTAVAAIELHGPYNYDLHFWNIKGTCTATIGFLAYGMGDVDLEWFHPNFATKSVHLDPNGDGLAGVCYFNRISHTISDNNSDNCLEFSSQHGNLREIMVDKPRFLLTPNNFDLVYCEVNNQFRDFSLFAPRIHPGSPGNYEYMLNASNNNFDAACGIWHNTIPAGGTGVTNNFPLGQIYT